MSLRRLIYIVLVNGNRDKSSSGHSVSFPETVAASSAEINGAVAFAVSGN